MPIGFGTDLMGALETEQLREFELRSAGESARQLLVAATATNADLIGRPELGVIDVAYTCRPGDLRRRSTRVGRGAVDVHPYRHPRRGRRLVIRTFLDLRVKPGHAEQLAAAFERLAILDESVAQSGCSSADLSVSADGTTVTVTATWDSTEAYAAWTSRDDRGDLADQLNEHLAQPLDAATVGRVHRILVSGAPGPTDGQRGTATMSNRIAIDVGGTFTDVVRLDSDGGLRFEKVPTTPAEPTHGVLAAFDRAEAPLDDTSMFTHGTTLGLNALLTRTGALDRGRRDEGVPRRLPPRTDRPRGQLQHLLSQAPRARGTGRHL